jgi:hypothetical protein
VCVIYIYIYILFYIYIAKTNNKDLFFAEFAAGEKNEKERTKCAAAAGAAAPSCDCDAWRSVVCGRARVRPLPLCLLCPVVCVCCRHAGPAARRYVISSSGASGRNWGSSTAPTHNNAQPTPSALLLRTRTNTNCDCQLPIETTETESFFFAAASGAASCAKQRKD